MRIKPLVVLSLVCSLSQAADTVASLGDSIKATQFVTAVDHTRLVNGTTEVIANANGTASIATANSVYGNPIFTIHAGSVFTGDTAEHSKTFTEDCIVDFSGVDLSGASPPFVVQDGWRFVGPTDDSVAKNLWCGPVDYPAWQFSLSNYDSGSPTATHVEDPGAQFSGSITVSRPRGVLIATVDNVLSGSTETSNYSRKFTTSQANEYVFVNPGDSNPIFSINPVDVSLFNGSIGIGSSTIDSLGVLYGIGKFQKNGYTYVFPYTDNTGSRTYTIATTSHFSGYATRNWVNVHEWDWYTQITNKPTNVSAFNNDVGYVTANHTHSNLVNGTTEVIANDDGTASIVNATELYGFKISARTMDQSRSGGNQPILIEMEIPVPLATFSDAMFRTVQSIRLRICEPLTGGNPREIVPWQTVALDHTKFGGPDSQWFGIADNAITQVNSEWFTDINPGYNWINDIYNAPFRINCENATVSSLYTSWGPLGSTVEDIVTTDLVGKKRQIATVDQIQPIATTIARQIIRDAVSNVSANVQTAEDARVALTNLITILKNL